MSEIRNKVLIGQVSMLYGHLIPNLFASLICAIVVLLGLLETSSASVIKIWFSSVVILTGIRLSFSALYHLFPQQQRMHLIMFMLGTTSAAILWGIVASLLMPSQLIGQTIVIVIIAGVSAGGMQTLNANLLASWLFLNCSVIPLAVWLLRQSAQQYQMLGIAMSLYLLFMMVACYRNHRAFMQYIHLHFQNTNLLEALKKQTILDPLTNLYNRRYLTEVLPREMKRSQRENSGLCVAIVDVDHFKKINDTYGHDVGDEVLKAIGLTLKNSFRESDYVFRLGGEEFLIILTMTTLTDAKIKLDKLREVIKEIRLFFKENTITSLSVSIGVTEAAHNTQSSITLLKEADAALYAAKNAGRDRVNAFVGA
ncbi:MAG: GGDEF domain-containing protein [Proteobacteria bacterium]|nr:GGDEF domain-containing protein [Pseudomonadota bacterium]